MYEYKFERLEASQFTWSGFQVDAAEYQNIMRQYPQWGWRFVQVFAPPLTDQGRAKYYELFFERELPDDEE